TTVAIARGRDMSTLSHDEAFAELDAVAFDLLDATEREAVMAHVSSCATCRAELDALQATSAELAFAARSPAVPAVKRHAIRDRLVSRATADSQARRLSNPPLVFPKSGPAEGPSGRRPVEWYAMAATVLLAVSLGFAAYALRD